MWWRKWRRNRGRPLDPWCRLCLLLKFQATATPPPKLCLLLHVPSKSPKMCGFPNRTNQKQKRSAVRVTQSYSTRSTVGWWGKKERSLQDLNLRGQCPSDFKSDALTTRPNEQYFRILHFLSQFNIYTLQKNHCLDNSCNPVEIFMKIKQHGCIPQQRSLWVPKNATNTCWFAGVLFYKDTKH